MKKNRKRTLCVLQGKLWNLAQHVSPAAWLQLCMLLSLIASATFKKIWPVQPKSPKKVPPRNVRRVYQIRIEASLPFPLGTKKHTRKKNALTSIPQKREEHTPVTTGTDFFCASKKPPHLLQRSTKVFKNLVSNCSTYFGYSEELAAPWPLQNVSERNW